MRPILLAILLLFAPAAGAERFTFVAFGDMPYCDERAMESCPAEEVRVARLMAAINAARPAFSIFLGDTKGGDEHCTDTRLLRALDWMALADHPLVYTPGDNEWTDCHRARAGGFDPLERLGKVRELFFADPVRSHGRAKIAVESQARVMAERFGKYVENARWTQNGVVFATVHVVGSNNNFEPGAPAVAMEYFERDAANVAWIDATFAHAVSSGAKAVVLSWQADVQDVTQKWAGEMPRVSGFVNTVNAVERGAKAFGKPVLVIHGDEHVFQVGRFLNAKYKPIPNVLRLEVMGAEDIHAVRVLVDPDSPSVFGFFPLLVPENGAF